jgi:hypothetical protein
MLILAQNLFENAARRDTVASFGGIDCLLEFGRNRHGKILEKF